MYRRAIAKRPTPRTAFDYAGGAAGAQIFLALARQASEAPAVHPSILRDGSKVATGMRPFVVTTIEESSPAQLAR